MQSGLARFVVRRTLFALGLVILAASAALLVAALAPHEGALDVDPTTLAAERARLGLDRPVAEQYVAWLARAVRLDFGESLRFRRPVGPLVRERASTTVLLGVSALLLATLLGIPAGVFTGSHPTGTLAGATRALSAVLLAVPPLVSSLVLLLLAVRTGWLPTGGLPPMSAELGLLAHVRTTLWHLLLPALALALPMAAWLERLQSASVREALDDPAIAAARARGIPPRRIIWIHAWRLSLTPVLAMYGILLGSALSGSFAVEIVTSWPGLGALTYEALRSRDLHLVAGCAAAGAACLALGILLSDLALAAVDPRVEESA